MAGSLKVWDGAGWQYVQLPQGGVTAQSTAPTSPTTGQLWLDTVSAPPGGTFADTGWIEVLGGVGFLNGWVNFGAPWETAGYRRINGIVYLHGLIKSGTINTNAFALPAGFRPRTGTHMFAPASNNTGTVNLTRLDIDGVSGNVLPQAGTNVAFSLDGVCFPADL